MKKPVGRPFAGSRLVRFLDKRILKLRPRKTQIELGAEAGFVATNMLAMTKNGSSRLPLDRVPALARALEVDPAWLFRLAVEQQDAALTVVIEEIFGTAVSRNEVAWLQAIRDASGDTDPTLTTKARRAIEGIFGK